MFIEPLGHAPLVNWFRKLTPKLRTPDEKPLLAADLAACRKHFKRAAFTFFNLTALGAAPFASTRLFTPLFSFLNAVDRGLFHAFPNLSRYAWMVFMDLREPLKYS